MTHFPMQRVVVIGQAPGRRGPKVPVGGRSARLLAGLLGITEEQFLDEYERFNLVNRFPGKKGKGDAFPADLARRNARRLQPRLHQRKVVMLGRGVAAAFGISMPFLDDLVVQRGRSIFKVLLLPHPSGVNHWWNHPRNRERAAEALRYF